MFLDYVIVLSILLGIQYFIVFIGIVRVEHDGLDIFTSKRQVIIWMIPFSIYFKLVFAFIAYTPKCIVRNWRSLKDK